MKYDCEVIRDLLPIYKDGVTNKKSNETIEAHFLECEKCKEYYHELNKCEIVLPEAVAVESQNVVNYGMRIKKRRRRVFAIVMSVIGVLILSIFFFGYYVITGGPAAKTSNAKDYGVFKNFNGYSNLYIFPKQMPQSTQIDSYYYYYRDTFLDPTSQIFLEYSLSEADFDAEVARLSTISERYEKEGYKDFENHIVYDETNFEYPAYVMIFNDNYCYEYALVNEKEHKIICVFTQFINPKEVRFDHKYLPKNFGNEKNSAGYNMYYYGSYFERHKR